MTPPFPNWISSQNFEDKILGERIMLPSTPFFFFSSFPFFPLCALVLSASLARLVIDACILYLLLWMTSLIHYVRMLRLSLISAWHPFYIYLMCYDAVVLSAFCCSHNCNVSVLQHLFSSSIQYRTVSDLLIVLSAILWTYFYISFSLYKT